MKKTSVVELLNYQYCGSKRENKMSDLDRAAQFSPFAALTAYEGVLSESLRETERRYEVDEERAEKINMCLLAVSENYPERTAVKLVYFVPEKKKSGGAYKTVVGEARLIDKGAMTIVFSDNTAIPIADIYDIELADQEAEF